MNLSGVQVVFVSMVTERALERDVHDDRRAGELRASPVTGGPAQRWTIEHAPGYGSYILAAESFDSSQPVDQMCIVPSMQAPGQDARLCIGRFTTDDAQKFYVEENGDGSWTLRSVPSGRVIELLRTDGDEVTVQLGDDFRLASQRWRADVVDSGV